MGVLSNELSSWRKNIVECPAHEVTTLNFRDTRPNVMLVMNPTDMEIMCNLDSIPTIKHYDFRIKNHYARLVGKPVATSQIYFLNNGNESVTLQVYSIYDKNFDPSWLSDFSIENVNIDSESIKPIVEAIEAQSKIEITGVSDGVRLPVADTATYGQLAKLLQDSVPTKMVNLASITTLLKEMFINLTEPGKLLTQGAVNIGDIHNLLNKLLTLLIDEAGLDINVPIITNKLSTLVSNNSTNNSCNLKSIHNIFNEDCAIKGTNFGSVLLNNEEPVEGFLGLYDVIYQLKLIINTLQTTLLKTTENPNKYTIYNPSYEVSKNNNLRIGQYGNTGSFLRYIKNAGTADITLKLALSSMSDATVYDMPLNAGEEITDIYIPKNGYIYTVMTDDNPSTVAFKVDVG